MVDQEAEGGKGLAPPYTAFLTIKNLVVTMKEHGIPDRVDRSVLSNMSGAVQGQVLTALKFLGLIGHNDGIPRTAFKKLVEASGTDQWQTELTAVVKAAYAPIFELKLESASPNQFNDKFRAAYPGADGDTLRKCITFFLNATRDAGIVVSPYIMRNKKPRAASTRRKPLNGKRLATAKAKDDGGQIGDEPDEDFHSATPPKTPFQVLMEDIYDPATMEPEEEKAVFTLARYLKVQETRE